MNLPTDVPLSVKRDAQMRPLGAVDPRFGVNGSYFDSDAAAASIAAVRGQGS